MQQLFVAVLSLKFIWGADHLGPISTKIGRVKGAHDVVILSNFSFNVFRGFRSTGGQHLHLPIDFPTAGQWSSLQQCCHYRAACDGHGKGKGKGKTLTIGPLVISSHHCSGTLTHAVLPTCALVPRHRVWQL